MGRRAETIILPLELLRHLKPSDFNDTREYNAWQKRQLRVLELGLLIHPSLPLDPSAEPFVTRLRAVVRSSDCRTLDAMRSLCNSAVSLSWRGGQACRWADGSPLNAHLYASLLGSAVFDPRDDTLVLDEVDELLELIAKTWPMLGIDRHFHSACFAWVLFRQYVATAMVEPDLLCAAHSVLAAEAGESGGAGELFGAVVGSVREWAEKRLTRYHEYFLRGTVGQIETLLPVALLEAGGEDSGDRVEHFIRSSVTHAFQKLAENGITGNEDVRSSAMLKLAKETEELVLREKKCFSPILNTWHSSAAAVAAATLHGCFGLVLRRYLRGVAALSADSVEVLETAARLEKTLVHVVVEDSVDCPDGGKSVVREMVPFDVDSFVSNLLKTWVGMRMERGRDCIQRAKENENWNPKSKADPYGQSGLELVRIAEETVKELFEIPIGMSEGLVKDVTSGLDTLFQDYTAFVASCAPKQSYIPALPPLTRCSKDSKLTKLWKKATPCGVNPDEPYHFSTVDPRQSTSRATQRLYIRLNTLHLILSRLNSLHKTLTLNLTLTGPFLDPARSSARSAAHQVAQSAAYRLIFLDSAPVFTDSLYSDSVHDSRIKPVLRALKQNLTLMCAVVHDPAARSSAAREVLRAALEAFLTVLLAGGPSRAFDRADHAPVQEDFKALKRAFEGLVPEGVVEREAEAAAGVVALMRRPTDELVEEFSVATCEASGAAGVVVAASQRLLPMPPTTGRWSSSDANTILRVLCHRDDRVANQFLKRNFQLPKRR